ncbi:MAG: hypothetical protein ACF8XB_25610 [Planctomycetota bacterium JB042]
MSGVTLFLAADAAAGGELGRKVGLVVAILVLLAVTAWIFRHPNALEEVALSRPLSYILVTTAVGLTVTGLFFEAAALGQISLYFAALFLGMLCLLVHVQLRRSRRADDDVARIGASVDRVMELLPGALSSASVRKIETVDDLFATLNRARESATCIRLMQLREAPPVETEPDGTVKLGPNGRPVYHNPSASSVRWYEGLREWCLKDGHQAERITNVDSAAMRAYADFVDADIPTGWTTFRIERGRPLPFANLCIFDSDRVLLTVELGGKLAYRSMTGLWIEDEGVATWLRLNYYEKMRALAEDA